MCLGTAALTVMVGTGVRLRIIPLQVKAAVTIGANLKLLRDRIVIVPACSVGTQQCVRELLLASCTYAGFWVFKLKIMLLFLI